MVSLEYDDFGGAMTITLNLTIEEAQDILDSLQYPGVHTGDPVTLAFLRLEIAKARKAEVAEGSPLNPFNLDVEAANTEPGVVGINLWREHRGMGYATEEVLDGPTVHTMTATPEFIRQFDPTDQDPT